MPSHPQPSACSPRGRISARVPSLHDSNPSIDRPIDVYVSCSGFQQPVASSGDNNTNNNTSGQLEAQVIHTPLVNGIVELLQLRADADVLFEDRVVLRICNLSCHVMSIEQHSGLRRLHTTNSLGQVPLSLASASGEGSSSRWLQVAMHSQRRPRSRTDPTPALYTTRSST